METRPQAAIEALRARIRAIEWSGGPSHGLLPVGLNLLDEVLPEHGLTMGALHEVAGGGTGAVDGAAAALFAAGIVARVPGRVLWCVTQPDLFAPAVHQAGLDPDRVI